MFDYSVGYNPNPKYNVFDKKTQNVYSPEYTIGDDGFINFAGGVRMEAAGISQNDIDGLAKFYSDSSNKRELFHQKHADSISEGKRIKSQNVSWDNWSNMGNADKLSLFKKMYGDTAVNSYDMLDGSELMGGGDGGKLSSINVSLGNVRGGGQTSFDARDSETFYNALNKGAIFGSQSHLKGKSQLSKPLSSDLQSQPSPSQSPSMFGNFANKQMQQPKPVSSFNGLRSIGMGGEQNKLASLAKPSMPNQKRNLIPRPMTPSYQM